MARSYPYLISLGFVSALFLGIANGEDLANGDAPDITYEELVARLSTWSGSPRRLFPARRRSLRPVTIAACRTIRRPTPIGTGAPTETAAAAFAEKAMPR